MFIMKWYNEYRTSYYISGVLAFLSAISSLFPYFTSEGVSPLILIGILEFLLGMLILWVIYWGMGILITRFYRFIRKNKRRVGKE